MFSSLLPPGFKPKKEEKLNRETEYTEIIGSQNDLKDNERRNRVDSNCR
jgi:hypothetical protein